MIVTLILVVLTMICFFFSFSGTHVLWSTQNNTTNTCNNNSSENMTANVNFLLTAEINGQTHDTACQHGSAVAQAPVNTSLYTQNMSCLVKKTPGSNMIIHMESNTYYKREFGFIPVQIPNITLPVLEGQTIEANNMQDWVVQAQNSSRKKVCQIICGHELRSLLS